MYSTELSRDEIIANVQRRINNKSNIGDPTLAFLFDSDTDFRKRKADKNTELLESFTNGIKHPVVGEVVNGSFFMKSSKEFLLDCGFKDFVRVPINTQENPFFTAEGVGYGTEFEVMVVGINENEFNIEGSVMATMKLDANNILDSIQPDQYITAKIDEITSAGYNCTIIMDNVRIQAFLPQVLAGVNKIPDNKRADLVGQELEMCVESFSSEKQTWILSRRKYLNLLKPVYLAKIDFDNEYTGFVTGTSDYGIFVELNECLSGMIYHTNIGEELTATDWKKIAPGTEIKFYVKEIIKGDRLILTQVKVDSLWSSIEVGTVYEGVIKDHKPFGTLIILDHETNGLIHSSVMNTKVAKLSPGDSINVEVIEVDRYARKIFLKKAKCVRK